MMVTDVAFMGAFAGSFTMGRSGAISPDLARVGTFGSLAGYVGSGALYHAAFDTRPKTALSVVVRTLAPLTFGAIGALEVHASESSKCKKAGTPEELCDHNGTEVGAMIGALIGMLGATVAEATIVVPDGRKPPPPPRASALSVSPSVAVQGSGGHVGVVGTF